MTVPDYLCHYYEAARGPLKNLSDCWPQEAEQVMERIRQEGVIFASKRTADYLIIRRELEQKIRSLFGARGGQPKRATPHYFIVGSSPWLAGWYQDGRELRVPVAVFDPLTVSLTYGDSFPAMRFLDGKPYRGQARTLHRGAGVG